MQLTASLPEGSSSEKRARALSFSSLYGPVAVARLLPDKSDPEYTLILKELVKLNLVRCQEAGIAFERSHFEAAFPELPPESVHSDTQSTAHVALSVSPVPEPTANVSIAVVPTRMGNTSSRLRHAQRDRDQNEFPMTGTHFHGFYLQEELGRGAFARVYLARETRLADRPVALKVTTVENNEPRRLAQLQHTNIVPIHTAFQAGEHFVVQMPYFGRQTLGDLIEFVRSTNQFPRVDGQVFTTTVTRSPSQPASLPQKSQRSLKSTLIGASTSTTGEKKQSAETRHIPTDIHPLREQFLGKTYIDSVLWIATRLADGLAHAHQRDILHLDLKPQNILIADDGQPMLLDFNLSYDIKNRDRDRVGGTWPYMAPEQIEEYAGVGTQPVTIRTDLYGLGVILYEMLTLRHPFPPLKLGPDGLAEAVQARRAIIPNARKINPAIPHAVDAIIRKLLAPNPADRYESAVALREDLQRQQDFFPLQHAPDRAITERVGKWYRRNPRALLFAVAVVSVFSVMFSAKHLKDVTHTQHQRHVYDQADHFLKLLPTLRADLTSLETDGQSRLEAIQTVRNWIQGYGAQNANWVERSSARLLSAADQKRLREALGEAAILSAQSEWMPMRARPEEERATAPILSDLQVAKNCFSEAELPRAVRLLESELAGKPTEDFQTEDESTVNLFVTAARDVWLGRYQDAAQRFETLTHKEPGHFAGQFGLGYCYFRMNQYTRALERLTIAQPLAPNDPRPVYNRGIVLWYSGKLEQAEKQFTTALELRPNWHPALQHRAVVRIRKKNYADAINDLTAAIAAGAPRLPTLILRAKAHEGMGNREAAERDRTESDAIEPKTEIDFVARGNRWASEPEKAVPAFESALKVNPAYFPALQNKAAVLDGKPDHTEECLAAMKKVVELAPQFAPARTGYAVLLARAGERDQAHESIRAAILLSEDPMILYQAANVYAITSRSHPGDRTTAIEYLRRAILQGFNQQNLLEKDRDMDNIRSTVEFQEILRAFKTLRR